MPPASSLPPAVPEAPTQHLCELGYVDPLDLARQQAALQQQLERELQQAQSLLQSGKPLESLAILTEVAKNSPQWIAPQRLAAHAEFAAGRLDAALEHLNWLECRGIEHHELALLRGAVAAARRRWDEALECAEYSRSLDSPNPAADLLIARIHLRRGRLSEAETILTTLLDKNGDDPQVLAAVAALALRRKDWAAAADWALQSLEGDFQATAVHVLLGIALDRLGRPAEAMRAFQAAITVDPRLAAPHRRLARIAEAQGDSVCAAAHAEHGREIIRLRRKSRKAS